MYQLLKSEMLLINKVMVSQGYLLKNAQEIHQVGMNPKLEIMIQTVHAMGIRCLDREHKKWVTKHCHSLQITCLMLPKDGSRQGA